MKCEQFIEWMSDYIDDQLTPDQKKMFEEHLEQCNECKQQLDELVVVMDAVHQLPEKELPDHFHEDLMLKLYKKKEETNFNKQKNTFILKNWKMFSSIAAAFLIIVIVGKGLGGMDGMKGAVEETRDYGTMEQAKSDDKMMVQEEMKPEVTNFKMTADVAESRGNKAPFAQKAMGGEMQQRKIIRKSNVYLEVEDFDKTVQELRQLTEKNGGYVENSNSNIYHSDPERKIYLKEGNIVLRIPSSVYGSSRERIMKMGHLVNESEENVNVTEQYMDTESRIRMLELQQERLLDIMGKANKVEDLIKLEQRLNEIRTELEIYKTKIKNWDKLVSYSTISVQITQIEKQGTIQTVAPNFGTKLKSSFVRSINDMRKGFERLVLALAYRIIPWTLWIIGFGIAFLLFKPIIIKIIYKFKQWKEK